MYSFEPRLPVNHVMQLVKNLRSGDFDRGDNLLLVGAISGEIGALLKSGFVVTMSDEDLPSTIAGCCNALDSLESVKATDDSTTAFDPSLLIPIILKLVELWLARRGS